MSTTLTSIFMTMRQSLQFSVMRIVRDPQIAEDLTQETYIRARKVLEREPLEHVEAFLHRAARNLALDHLRRTGTRIRHEVQG